MSERLLQQLKKVTRVSIPDLPSDFRVLSIPKQENLGDTPLNVGDQLLIEVPDYIIHPPATFDLHRKWNNNTSPQDYIMQAVVLKCLGKMIYVETMGYDVNTQSSTGRGWTGWLPRASIKIKTRYGV